MSFRQGIENNIVLFFLGTLATGFGCGWGAYWGIQSATGLTSISIDRLKELERPVDKRPVDKNVLESRIKELEGERDNLLQRLASNRPTTGNYVRNVVFTPTSPAVIAVGSNITVRFDYVLVKDEKARIWASGDGPSLYYGSALVSGAGTEERQLTAERAGKMREVIIRMQNVDGETLYEMKLPVDFTFK